MSNLEQAARQALYALEAMQSYAAAERKGLRICDEAITALRAALAQQAEPVVCAVCEQEIEMREQQAEAWKAQQQAAHNPLHNSTRLSPALQEWLNKTQWVQDTAQPHELGLHRATVLRLRIEQLQQLNAELELLLHYSGYYNDEIVDTPSWNAAIKTVQQQILK